MHHSVNGLAHPIVIDPEVLAVPPVVIVDRIPLAATALVAQTIAGLQDDPALPWPDRRHLLEHRLVRITAAEAFPIAHTTTAQQQGIK